MFLNWRTEKRDDPKEDFITEDPKKNAITDDTNRNLIFVYPKYGLLTDDLKEDSIIGKKQ